jgi:hypothetical protein
MSIPKILAGKSAGLSFHSVLLDFILTIKGWRVIPAGRAARPQIRRLSTRRKALATRNLGFN